MIKDGRTQRKITSSLQDTINGILSNVKDRINLAIEILIVKEKMLTETDFLEFYRLIEQRLYKVKKVYLDTTHCFRTFPMLAYTAINAIKVQNGLKIEDIYYGILDNDIVNPRVKRNILSLANPKNKDEEVKFNDILTSLESFVGDSAELLNTGKVLTLKELDSVTNWSMCIARYTRDHNLLHLVDIFKNFNSNENLKNLENNLDKGALFENLSFHKEALSYLKDFYQGFKDIKNKNELPAIFLFLAKEIEDRLDWVNQDNHAHYLLQHAKIVYGNFSGYKDILRSVCYIYEALHKQAYTIRVTIFNNNLTENNVLKEKLEELGVILDLNKIANIKNIIKMKKMTAEKMDSYQNDILINALYDRNCWLTVKTLRNSVIHTGENIDIATLVHSFESDFEYFITQIEDTIREI